MSWGYHLILDCANCDHTAITDPRTLASFAEELVSEIKMTAYGEPQIIHFGDNEPELAGWTVIQLIETSNIIAHFCDLSNDGYIDVFSCRKFDCEVAVSVVNKFFKPGSIRRTYLERQA